ncbi:hypothetical protein A9Q83_02515 [Alphaproteobacteria bacterium 46_93_T64]|nr:hypothetical protein A9Q83_02515 [Alphaproteobacteria bacterium 46_93_T64]
MKRLRIIEKLKRAGLFSRFIREKSGLAMLEFAMLLPMMMVLMLGSFEVGRYALLTQKIDRISATLGDLVARAEALSAAEVDNLFNSTDHLAKPFDFSGSGMVVVSSVVGRDGQEPLIIGQRSRGSVGSEVSKIGSDGGEATLPPVFTDGAGQTLADGEGVIVTEVFYSYAPYFAGAGGDFLATSFLGSSVMYRQSFFRPRLSEQTTFD